MTFTRIDALATGGLLGLWLAVGGDTRSRVRFVGGLAIGCGAILTLGLIRDGGAVRDWSAMSQTLNYSAIAGLGASLIGWSRLSPDHSLINRILSSWPLPFLGKYSYSMYMFHIWLDAAARATRLHPAVNVRLQHLAGARGTALPMVLYFLIVMAVLSGISLISWNLIEKRFLALKDAFEYRTEPTPQSLVTQVAH